MLQSNKRLRSNPINGCQRFKAMMERAKAVEEPVESSGLKVERTAIAKTSTEVNEAKRLHRDALTENLM